MSASEQTGQLSWGISSNEFSFFFSYYVRLTPKGHLLGGLRAREFFLQSRLPTDTLSKIWTLSDVDQDGQLNAAEFATAMHLIHLAVTEGGVQFPDVLPPELVTCVDQSMVLSHLPVPDSQHLMKCKNAFTTFQCNNGRGVLGAEAARYLLMKSNLSQGQLFHIWKLSDKDEDGFLTFEEFTVAMQLIFAAKLGCILPIHLEHRSLLPSAFYPVIQKVQEATERLPITQQAYVDPFTPPGTPVGGVPSDDDQQQQQHYVDRSLFEMPPEAFREGRYQSFSGNPFQQVSLGILRAYQNGPGLASEGSIGVIRGSNSGDPLCHASSHSSLSSTHSSTRASGVSGASEVVQEHDAPVLQQVEAIDVVESSGSREDTPIADADWRGPGRSVGEGGRWGGGMGVGGGGGGGGGEGEGLREGEGEEEEEEEKGEGEYPHPDVMASELESLSRASRKFLEETGGAVGGDQAAKEGEGEGGEKGRFGMEEYRLASMKGLSKVIEEVEREGDEGEEEREEEEREEEEERREWWEADTSGSELDVTGHQQLQKGSESSQLSPPPVFASDIDKHFGSLEAEIMSALSDANAASDTTADNNNNTTNATKSGTDTTGTRHTGTTGGTREGKVGNTEGGGDKRKLRGNVPAMRHNKQEESASAQQQKATAVPQVKLSIARTSPQKPQMRAPVGHSDDMDLDSYLESELASINDMFAEFEATDQKKKERLESEVEEIKAMESKSSKEENGELLPKVTNMEDVSKRRSMESLLVQQEWEKQMKEIEEQKMKELSEQEKAKEANDSAIIGLEKEWETVLCKEEQMVRETQREKELMLQREKEEEERLKNIVKEAKEQEEMSVEEWIEWMDKNKRKSMNPREEAEYERRKQARLEKFKREEEKRKREEEEQIRRTRERMETEYRMVKEREESMKSSRINPEQLQELQREQNRREEIEKKEREERARHRMEEFKQREIEDSKSKARSSLAARWEQQVKARTLSTGGGKKDKDYRSTVVSGPPDMYSVSLEKEEARVLRKLSYPTKLKGSLQNGNGNGNGNTNA